MILSERTNWQIPTGRSWVEELAIAAALAKQLQQHISEMGSYNRRRYQRD
jgi:hypothetical protein